MTLVLGAGLIAEIFSRWQLLIDVVLLLSLGGIHILAWQSPPATQSEAYKESAQTGIRAAASGGLTVAGILIPLSILTIGLSAQQKGLKLPSSVLVDFFMSN